MSFYSFTDPVDLSAQAEFQTTAPTESDRAYASEYSAALDRKGGLFSTVGAAVAGAVPDLVDTVSASVGITERGEVNQTVLNALNSPGLSAWMTENQGAAEVGSGVLGVILADSVAGRILRPTSKVMQVARNIPYVKNIATLDKQYESAKRVAMIATGASARRGAMGAERFTGGVMEIPYLGGVIRTSQGEANRRFLGASARKTLARNLATEGVMAATLNENSMLFDDDLSWNLMLGAAGLGVGQVIDSLIATHTLRKIANSDKIRQLNRRAYDPSGIEDTRLRSFGVSDEILRTAGVDPRDFEFQFQGGGGTTDLVTSYMIQAAENANRLEGTSEFATTLSRNREAHSTQLMKISHDLMDKVTSRGIRGVADSGARSSTEGFGAPIRESLSRDPLMYKGVEELGVVPDGLTAQEVHEMRQRFFEKELTPSQEILANGAILKKSKNKKGEWTDNWVELTDEQRDALRTRVNSNIFANSHTPFVILEPGEKSPLAMAKIAEGYTPIRPLLEGGLRADDPKAIWSIKFGDEPGERVGLSNDGVMYLPKGKKDLSELTPHEMLHMYHVSRTLVNHHVRAGATFRVPDNPSFLHLDIAEEITERSGGAAKINWPKNMTPETAKIESLAQKVDAMRAKERELNIKGVPSEEDLFQLKVMYNLPRVDSATAGLLGTSEHPMDLLLHGLKSGDEVRKMSYPEVLSHYNQSRQIAGLTDDIKPVLESVKGSSFDFLLDRDGNPIKPIIGYLRPTNPLEWSRDEMFVRHALKNAQVQTALGGEAADPLTRQIYAQLLASPAASMARNVNELADDQARSFIPGFRHSAPQTTRGSLVNAHTMRGRRDVDSPIMLAASQVQETKSRIMQAMTKNIFESIMGDAISQIGAPRNAKSATLLNQMLSHGKGWDLLKDTTTVTLPDGTSARAFVLNHESKLNQLRFEEAYGRQLDKGQVLLNPNGQTIILDELAMDTFSRMQSLYSTRLTMQNTLLKSQGLRQIAKKDWYVPPARMKGKYVSYTFDSNDNVVPGLTAIGDTPEQLAKMQSQISESPLWKDSYRMRSRDDVGEFMDLFDKAQMEFVDPETTVYKPGKRSFGLTGGTQINEQAFSESMVSMHESFLRHGDDMIEILFEAPIKSAKTRAEIAKVETRAGDRAVRHSSQYDRYLENLLGKNALSASDSFYGNGMRWLESRIDQLLGPTGSAVSKNKGLMKARIGQAYRDFLRVAGPKTTIKGDQFQRLSEELGNYMPYKSAAEMLEARTGFKTPPEFAKISNKLSWFESGHRLRWLETMHGVVNIGSMVANMPSVIRALQPKMGETVAEAAARNSSLAMMTRLPDGTEFNMLNWPKLTWESMMDTFFRKGHTDPIIAEAERKAFRLGYMSQEVSEMNRAFAAIDSRNGFKAFFMGDPLRKGNSTADRFIRSGGIDKWLGYLSDKTEDLSRQWGMNAGFRVGKALGMTADEMVELGHELTNKMIANYDPRNRPEIFQGPAGSMIGLFQSYVFNFYSRMFRYIETQDMQALATQFAMQGAVFGVDSLPGWDALNYAFFDRGMSKGEDPVESMYSRFGSGADWILHGTLSNLPKIFGADGGSLYTRGDVAVRLPGSQWTMLGDSVPVPNIPIADTAIRAFRGFSEGMGLLWSEQPTIGVNQLAEIASNTIVNRPLAGVIESLGTDREAGTLGPTDPGNYGVDTSFDGQVAAEAKTFGDAVYRMLGIRSMGQQKQIDQFYSDKTYNEEQAAKRSQMNRAVRAAIRDGRFDEVPGIFESYVKHGGDPRRYTRFVKDAFDAALDSRSERALRRALNDTSNRSNAAIARLLDGQVDIGAAEQSTDDYGREAMIEQLIAEGWEDSPNVMDDSSVNPLSPF